jgi:hypothetical protein
MPIIGKQFPVAALTASDIADGVVSTAKIADNAVTADKTSYKDVPFRNIIINGDMSVAQRATSASSITTSGYRTVDRFTIDMTTLGTWTISQDTDVPTGQGFATSLKLDNTTADGSPGSNDALQIVQKFEGQNLQHLKKGTASAESLTLSFWIKATKTGTNIVELYDLDNGRQISQSYTVDSTDTWEQKEITFAGDTTGAFGNDNAASLQLDFFFGAGSNYTSGTLNTSWASGTTANRAVGQVNHADSTSNNIWITGVQLEVGTTASDFEFLPYDVNLNRCLRYYEKNGDSVAGCYYSGRNDGISRGLLQFIVPKRAAPTCTVSVRGNATWDLASVFTVSLYNFDFGRGADYASFSLYTASAEL